MTNISKNAELQQSCITAVSKSALISELQLLIKSYKKEIIECRDGKKFHSKDGGSMYGVYAGKLKTLNKVVLELNKLILGYVE